MNDDKYIILNNLNLVYELYYDKTNSVKEYFSNIFKSRGYVEKKKDKLYALKNINLTIRDGERIGVIGFNGAGKSTLLKVLSGLLKPTSGSIQICGDVQPLIEIGAGFEPEFSGRENIYLNGTMLGFTKKEISQKEKEIIEFSELQDFIDVPIKYYSTGMAIKLAFSIATIVRPEILLLDEMLAAGDIAFIDKAKQKINEILNAARIIVLVSHDLNLIKSIANRTIILDKGKIVFDGDTTKAIEKFIQMANEKKNINEHYLPVIAINEILFNNGINVITDRKIEIVLRFTLHNFFKELFIILTIKHTKSGLIIYQYGNSYSNYILQNLEIGKWEVMVNLLLNNFKNDIYSLNVTINGIMENGMAFSVTSNSFDFEVKTEDFYLGNDCNWDIKKISV